VESQGGRGFIGVHGALAVIASLHREGERGDAEWAVLKSGYEEAYFSQRANLPAPTGRLFAAVLARIVL